MRSPFVTCRGQRGPLGRPFIGGVTVPAVYRARGDALTGVGLSFGENAVAVAPGGFSLPRVVGDYAEMRAAANEAITLTFPTPLDGDLHTFFVVGRTTGTTTGTSGPWALIGPGRYIGPDAQSGGEFLSRIRSDEVYVDTDAQLAFVTNDRSETFDAHNQIALIMIRFESGHMIATVNNNVVAKEPITGGSRTFTEWRFGRNRLGGLMDFDLMEAVAVQNQHAQAMADALSAEWGVSAPLINPFLGGRIITAGTSVIAGAGDDDDSNGIYRGFANHWSRDVVMARHYETVAFAGAQITPQGIDTGVGNGQQSFDASLTEITNDPTAFTGADCVVIEAGINDLQQASAPLGTMASRDNTTIYGGIWLTLQQFATNNPVTPLLVVGQSYTSGELSPNAQGVTGPMIRQAWAEMSALFGNSYVNAGDLWDENDVADLTIETSPPYTHPTTAGHILMANVMATVDPASIAAPVAQVVALPNDFNSNQVTAERDINDPSFIRVTVSGLPIGADQYRIERDVGSDIPARSFTAPTDVLTFGSLSGETDVTFTFYAINENGESAGYSILVEGVDPVSLDLEQGDFLVEDVPSTGGDTIRASILDLPETPAGDQPDSINARLNGAPFTWTPGTTGSMDLTVPVGLPALVEWQLVVGGVAGNWVGASATPTVLNQALWAPSDSVADLAAFAPVWEAQAADFSYVTDPAPGLRIEQALSDAFLWDQGDLSGVNLDNTAHSVAMTFRLSGDTNQSRGGVGMFMKGTLAGGDMSGIYAVLEYTNSSTVAYFKIYELTPGNRTPAQRASGNLLTFSLSSLDSINIVLSVVPNGASWDYTASLRINGGTLGTQTSNWDITATGLDLVGGETGGIGIACRNGDAPAGGIDVFELGLGINGQLAPNAGSGTYFVDAANFYVDLVNGDNGNDGLTALTPRLDLPSAMSPGAVCHIAGKVPTDKPLQKVDGGAPGNEVTLDLSNLDVDYMVDFGAFTSQGGNVWRGAIPLAQQQSLASKPNLNFHILDRAGARMRMASMPYADGAGDPLVGDRVSKLGFPFNPFTNSTANTLTVPDTPVANISNADVRAQLQALYPTAVTIRDVVNQINAQEPLTVKAWIAAFGNHNTRQLSRVSAYNTSTGVITFTDQINPSTVNGDRGFWIINHPSGMRVENQFLFDYASDTIDVFSAADPSGEVSGGQDILGWLEFTDAANLRVDFGGQFLMGVTPKNDVSNPITVTRGQNVRLVNGGVKYCRGWGGVVAFSNSIAAPGGLATHCGCTDFQALDVGGYGIVSFGGRDVYHTNIRTLRTERTSMSMRAVVNFLLYIAWLEDPLDQHASLGISLYRARNKNARLVLVRIGGFHPDVSTPAITMHSMDTFDAEGVQIYKAGEGAGFQIWSFSNPRQPGRQNFSIRNCAVGGPGASFLAILNNPAMSAGEMQNNIGNMSGLPIVEDQTLTRADPQTRWREVDPNTATITGGVLAEQPYVNRTATGGTYTSLFAPEGEEFSGRQMGVTFGSAGGEMSIVLPDWSDMPVGGGVNVGLDIRGLYGRGLSEIGHSVIVTTDAGVKSPVTGILTGLIEGEIPAGAANVNTVGWEQLRIVVPGFAGETVLSVEIILSPNGGFATGVADAIEIARPSGWWSDYQVMSRRGRNAIYSTTDYGSTIGPRDFVAASRDLFEPVTRGTEWNLIPRRVGGVLVEPQLVNGDTVTANGATLNWIGPVNPATNLPI